MGKILIAQIQKILQSNRSRISRKIVKFVCLICLGLLGSFFLLTFSPRSLAKPIQTPPQISQTTSLLERGLSLHRAGNYTQAINLWRQAARDYARQEDTLGVALTGSYLSLSYQELGQWQDAEDAITQSLNLLQSLEDAPQSSLYFEVLAKTLNTQGRWQWEQGQWSAALATWKQATWNYQQAEHNEGIIISLINQAQVLQILGFSTQAQATLATVYQNLQGLPNSKLKSTGMIRLGQALRQVGRLEDSQQILQASLAITNDPPLRSSILLELGNTLGNLGEQKLAIGETKESEASIDQALDYYQQAQILATNPTARVKAQLNQFRWLIKTKQWLVAKELKPNLQSLIQELPPSRTALYARLNFAQSLIQSLTIDRHSLVTSDRDIAQIIDRAIQQAKQFQDPRLESSALGQLGRLNELNQQWSEAQVLTEQALWQLEGRDANDLRYRWEWQLGRLLQQQGQWSAAILAYNSAIASLESVREDLLLVEPEIQFSFRDLVEPLYRGLVDLLLQTDGGAKISQVRLNQAIQAVDALQLAELENFLHCDLSSTASSLDRNLTQVDSDAVLIYPILLDDRLEVIFQFPGQPLQHHAQPVSRLTAEKTLRSLRRFILRGDAGKMIELSGMVYQWLIEPLEAELNRNSEVKTLVFVLDGELRNLPMAVLYDAKSDRYLIEKQYGITLLPSLQLWDLAAKPSKFQVLGGGISQSLQKGDRLFAALDVTEELEQVQPLAASEILLDREFNRSNLQQKLKSEEFSIVHLATHGNFSSNPEETYILVSSPEREGGELLKANDLDRLLRQGFTSKRQTNGIRNKSIDLLILSACKTAEGDNRATLGLAGLAVKAGASSTLATLWQVTDNSTVKLMEQFYQALNQPGISKTEALRLAQLKLLQNPQYQTPYYWAPYVLVGNWR